MRPLGPLPFTWPASTPFSAITAFATGVACASTAGAFALPCPLAGAATFALGAASSFLGASALAFFSAFTLVSTFATTSPTATSVSGSTSRVILPSSSLVSSSVALSLSISAMGWSFSTTSPFSTSHWAMRTSEMLSPGLGTLISTSLLMGLP